MTNAADAKTGVRNEPVGRILEAMVVEDQRRFYTRLTSASSSNGAMPPNVLAHLEAKRDKFVQYSFVSLNFADQERSIARLTFGENKTTRCVTFRIDSATCECGVDFLDDSPCGCMLFAADKAGIPWSSLLNQHDSLTTWKHQYDGLVEFVVPGTAQLRQMQPDLEVLPPSAFPISSGRPNNKRKKSITETWKKSKHASKKERMRMVNEA